MEKRLVRLINEEGYLIGEAFVDKLTHYTITRPAPGGLFLPRWNGEEWVEGGEPPPYEPREISDRERLNIAESDNAFLLYDSMEKEVKLAESEQMTSDLLYAFMMGAI